MRTADLATLDVAPTLSPAPSGLDARRLWCELAAERRRREALEVELARLRAEQVAARLIPGFAHAMNNALNAVVGLSQLLVEDLETTADVACMKDITRAASHAVEMVGQLRSLTECDRLGPCSLDAREAFDRTARTLRLLLPRRATLEVDCRIEASLQVDAARLDRIAALLLSVFRLAPGDRARMQLTVRAVDGEVVATFTRAEAAIGARLLGADVDAALREAERLSSRSGGRIDVDTQLDGRVRVVVTLPARAD